MTLIIQHLFLYILNFPFNPWQIGETKSLNLKNFQPEIPKYCEDKRNLEKHPERKKIVWFLFNLSGLFWGLLIDNCIKKQQALSN